MNIKNKDMPMFPCECEFSTDAVRGRQTGNFSGIEIGLTKREFFASMALQGLLAGDAEQMWSEEKVAESAVRHADELLKALSAESTK